MLGKKLKKGDTIGIIAPASPETKEALDRGVEFLKGMGFNIVLGDHVNDRWGYLAGSDEDRVSDLMSMFTNKNIDTILCVRGGYGTSRILPLIDFNVIKNNPKIFVGFSDITTLLNNFNQKCGLITFHGPMASSNLRDEETLKSLLNTLMEGNKPYTIKNPDSIPFTCGNSGTVQGKLVGGNLSLISTTLGTPYEIDTNDSILFIEDVKEEPYALDRMLTQLNLSGKLASCKGIILGQFKGCELPHYERSLTLEEIFQDRILKLGKPTLINFMSGHAYPKLTLPIGAEVKLCCDEGKIEVLSPVVE